MKNQARHKPRASVKTALLAVFLAALLPVFLAAAPVPKLTIQGDAVIEITGGEGRNAWRLAYGTLPIRAWQGEEKWAGVVILLPAGPNRAWFSHSRWLRLIDTEKGVVIGRWPFPAPITEMRPDGGKLRVQVQEGASGPRSYRREIVFDAAKPDIPFWPVEWLMLLRVSSREIYYEWPVEQAGGKWYSFRLKPEEAKSVLPASEEAVRRDPLSPWLAVKLWRLRTDAGDPRAKEALQQALQTAGSDYTELLRISGFLEDWGASEEADRFFDAGYRDFLARDCDPRLFSILLDRMMVYWANTERFSPQRRDVYLTNQYHLAPWIEGGELAWRAYRNQWGVHTKVWEERAEYARQSSLYPITPAVTRFVNDLLLISSGTVLACLFCLFVLYLRYRPQRALDAITYKRLLGPVREHWNLFNWLGLAVVAGVPGAIILRLLLLKYVAPTEPPLLVLFWIALVVGYVQAVRLRARRKAIKEREAPKPPRAFFCIEYWSPHERLVFLLVVLLGWFAAGLIRLPVQKYSVFQRQYVWSMGAGHLGSPITVQYLEKKPPAPGRDLFLALAYQQTGEPDKAEALYRRIPQFAESWNNLGVLLQRRGRTEEAQRAFEQALRIDPQLQEARLNAGQGARGEWAELHKKYVPGQPMLAPPRRTHLVDILAPITWKDYLAVSAGPFSLGLSPLFLQGAFGELRGWDRMPVVLPFSLVPLMALAIVALLLIPAREVSQPPGPLQPLWEALFPGTAARWSFGAVVILAFWGYSILRWMFFARYGTPYLVDMMIQPSISRAFGLMDVPLKDILKPGWLLTLGIPALVFVANLVVVLIRRPEADSRASRP